MKSHQARVSKKGLVAVGGVLAAATGILLSTFGSVQPTVANPVPKQSAPQLLAQRQRSITIVFPTRKDAPNLQNQANKVAQFLSKELRMPVKAQISDETAAVEALRRNSADIAFLSSRPALKAEQLANARLHLGEVRDNYSGKHTYCSVFLVPKNSSLRTLGDKKATLEQLRGKKMAFTSPTSGSGFLFPTSELIKYKLVPNREGLDRFFGQVAYGGDYSKAIMEVVRGRADVAAVSEYAQFPPYITEADRNKLRVLYRICGVPAHGIVFNDEIPVVLRERIINALLKLNKPENNELLKGLYNSTELVRVDHNRHLQVVREAVKNLGMD